MKLNSKSIFALSLVLLLPGCWGRKSDHDKHHAKHHKGDGLFSQVDIPTADEAVKSYFDSDIGEFELMAEEAELAANSNNVNEYTWVDEAPSKQATFKTVYFDFDRAGIKDTQKENVAYDVTQARKVTADDEKVIVEGHACHSAGSRAYNLAISERRAKELEKQLIAGGVPRENIKVVGRGEEVPAVIDGKQVTGDRNEQWPNRRAELRVLS